MRYHIPPMLEAGARDYAIVNVTSIYGTVARPRQRRLYGRQAWCSRPRSTVRRVLRINCVGPAYIETPLLTDLPDEVRRQLVAPSSRPARTTEGGGAYHTLRAVG